MINEIVLTKGTLMQAERQERKNNSNGVELTYAPKKIPEILFITSYPPRECGIATYSQDLIKALNNKFNRSFKINICPLESDDEQYTYNDDVEYILNTTYPEAFKTLARFINNDANIEMVMIQHEFGLFKDSEEDLLNFLKALYKPVIVVFHTVLPKPNIFFKIKVQQIASIANSIVVMTNSSAKILVNDYDVPTEKITFIPHGTHLVSHSDKLLLKKQHNLEGRKILSTFGLLSSGKSIETTLDAMPAIIKQNPDVLFLIIGKTHPSVIKNEGEKYRNMLLEKVATLKLEEHVRFINYFLPLPDLLEHLQLTDIYLFTSKDPNQAVSGTFSYALSCGCAVVSTAIPHAIEVLKDNAGIIVDFENSVQLGDVVINLLNDHELRKNVKSNGLHKMASTAWENAAISHATLFKNITDNKLSLRYNIPPVNLNHVKNMTTPFGMIQFAKINQPDIDSGYTLDDNARALIAMCQHLKLTGDEADIKYITIYFNFIKFCLQSEGYFLNYVNEQKQFTQQNSSTNLADSNGRAIWALGFLISVSDLLPKKLAADAEYTMQTALLNVSNIHSTRAMAFIIKGLYYSNLKIESAEKTSLIEHFANRLVQMYRHEAEYEWAWFESYLTYGNSLLPEAMLCAWMATQKIIYKEIAKSSFDFLLSKIFRGNSINVISNKGWSHKGDTATIPEVGGEQPIDVAYTILALQKFYDVFKEEKYSNKIEIAFNWFLGNNHLNQIIYNPCTGGCYDGLEENYVNLNQGAESTVSYLMARLTVENSLNEKQTLKHKERQYYNVST
jgi:glycosyltransferase involved in cell wall biosynthesis